jgi:hypothetical protein
MSMIDNPVSAIIHPPNKEVVFKKLYARNINTLQFLNGKVGLGFST